MQADAPETAPEAPKSPDTPTTPDWQRSAKKTESSRINGRKGGRPRGRCLAGVPWDEIEDLYCRGEPKTNAKGQTVGYHFPSFRELALRFKDCIPSGGPTHNAIFKRSKRFAWQSRREQFKTDVKRETDLSVAKARGLSTASQIAIVDVYVHQFLAELQAGRVRKDSIADLDKALRCRAFLRGEADSRSEQTHKFSLSDIQDRHRESRKALELASSSDAVAGVLPEDERGRAVDVEGVEVPPAFTGELEATGPNRTNVVGADDLEAPELLEQRRAELARRKKASAKHKKTSAAGDDDDQRRTA